MPKKAKELSALGVRNLSRPGTWPVGGVSGLYLQVLKTGGKSWILRIVIAGRRRELGLGGFPDTTLSLAREKAREARKNVERGVDPVQLKQAVKSKLIAEQAAERTFEQCGTAYLKAHSLGWKHEKTKGQWEASLRSYVYPVMGKVLIREIDQSLILRCLEPIWSVKTDTASRVRSRIESILAYATVCGYRSGENPAQWRHRLDKLLPQPSRLKETRHFPALHYQLVGDFRRQLQKLRGYSARALELLILTAVRSGEVRGATWDEIDGDVWTIPAERMKAGKQHRVPLSSQAIDLIHSLVKLDGCPYLFPGTKGQQLSDMSLLKVVRSLEAACVPHGFRSSFRDWVGDCTVFPREIAEQALAHSLRDKTEASYRRADALIKRRALMQAWADYCDKPQGHVEDPDTIIEETVTYEARGGQANHR